MLIYNIFLARAFTTETQPSAAWRFFFSRPFSSVLITIILFFLLLCFLSKSTSKITIFTQYSLVRLMKMAGRVGGRCCVCWADDGVRVDVFITHKIQINIRNVVAIHTMHLPFERYINLNMNLTKCTKPRASHQIQYTHTDGIHCCRSAFQRRERERANIILWCKTNRRMRSWQSYCGQQLKCANWIRKSDVSNMCVVYTTRNECVH